MTFSPSSRACFAGPTSFNRTIANDFFRALEQAEEQEHRRHCEALQDEEDNKAEIYNHVTGDFLTEAKEQAESTRGPDKPLATRYKGMTADQLRAFRDAQALQMKEIEVKAAERLVETMPGVVTDARARFGQANKKGSVLLKKSFFFRE